MTSEFLDSREDPAAALWGGGGGAGDAEREKRIEGKRGQLRRVSFERATNDRDPRTWNDLHRLEKTSRSVLEDEAEEGCFEGILKVKRGVPSRLGDRFAQTVQEEAKREG